MSAHQGSAPAEPPRPPESAGAVPNTTYPTVWEARTDEYIIPVRVSGQLMVSPLLFPQPSKQKQRPIDTRFVGLQRRSDGSYDLQLVDAQVDPSVAGALQAALDLLDQVDVGRIAPYSHRLAVKNEIRIALDAVRPPTA